MRLSLRDLPIKRKLMLVTVLTSGFALRTPVTSSGTDALVR